MTHTRRDLLASAAGAVAFGSLAGCLGGGNDSDGDGGSAGVTAQSTFFVFGDVAAQVAGDTATAELLVPLGQHGHGWEPGPRVRQDIRDADVLFHGMDGFQPWVGDIAGDLAADGADVTTVDVSADVDLLAAGASHDHGDGKKEEQTHEEGGDDHDDGAVDPHFWMDPTRVRTAVGTVREALADVDTDDADAYADNAEAFGERLAALDERIASTVEAGSKDVILVAGHDAFQYLGDRYGVRVESLTGVSPDDRPTPADIQRAQEIIDAHDLSYICADPLESQQAADQLVAETDAEDSLPLTSIPGLKDEWDEDGWGYVDVMENVNLPTLERALGA